MLGNLIQHLSQRQDLTQAQMQQAAENMLQGDNPLQSAAFLSLLHAKGETTTELLALIDVCRQQMQAINLPVPVLDIVGTGGDGMNTVNISTGSALLAAACGVNVVKHGNRAVSSRSGSADVIEALGLPLHDTPEAIVRSVKQHRFAFCYAPNFHPALGKLQAVRRDLAIPTCFNLLGPLLNPARAQYVLLGVANPKLLITFAELLARSGTQRSLVVHCQGCDEICTLGDVEGYRVERGSISPFHFRLSDYQFMQCQLADLQGGDAKENAARLLEVFQGQMNPLADTLILNAGIACYLYGISHTLQAGIDLAQQLLLSGQVYQHLDAMRGDA